ncbi:MAG: hypothetical protein RIT27_1390 [Pseudomonadota bacterium]|jgi:hypothetical protein
MANKILYETKNVQMYIDESVPCLVNVWSGFVPSKHFRDAILKLVELLKEHRPHYPKLHLLADTRTLGVVSRDDVQWVSDKINPLYLEAGAQFEAFVLSEDAFGQMAVKRYVSNTTEKDAFTVQMFTTLEDAKAWLISV